jgi:uncharacterized phage protein (TIGR01671 family)
MRRKIQFRVWDIQNERMVENPYLFEPAYYPEDKKIADYIFFETWQDVDDGIRRSCHLMQFTGLYDKNGNNIYEGDVMTLKSDGKPTAIIVWGFAGWEFKWIDSTFKRIRQSITEPVFRNIALFEKIGNIYHNPEWNVEEIK